MEIISNYDYDFILNVNIIRESVNVEYRRPTLSKIFDFVLFESIHIYVNIESKWSNKVCSRNEMLIYRQYYTFEKNSVLFHSRDFFFFFVANDEAGDISIITVLTINPKTKLLIRNNTM